jgi:hypothetical protein
MRAISSQNEKIILKYLYKKQLRWVTFDTPYQLHKLFAIYIMPVVLGKVLLILPIPITEAYPRVSDQCINKCQQFLQGGFVCDALSLHSELHVPMIRATGIQCGSSSLMELITAKSSLLTLYLLTVWRIMIKILIQSMNISKSNYVYILFVLFMMIIWKIKFIFRRSLKPLHMSKLAAIFNFVLLCGSENSASCCISIFFLGIWIILCVPEWKSFDICWRSGNIL